MTSDPSREYGINYMGIYTIYIYVPSALFINLYVNFGPLRYELLTFILRYRCSNSGINSNRNVTLSLITKDNGIMKKKKN